MTIGFSAALTTFGLQLGDHQAVEYDRVYTNLGNRYDRSTGHFTAPVHGLYQFATTVAALQNKNIHVQIVKNGATIASTYAENGGWDMGSVQAIVELDVGDRVWVRHHEFNAIQTIHGSLWSTFSGALIKQI